ncbi:pyrroline-5-carboxylate reductase [bacterium]|nr:pyrroline-5-carboxylate reductase [bacterium]
MLAFGKIAVLGVGKIGEALIRGFMERGGVAAGSVVGTTGHEESHERLRSLGIGVARSNAEAVRDAALVVIAVKPSVVRGVLSDIAGRVPKQALVVSVAASVTTAAIEDALGGEIAVVRAMPNTPCLLGEGMTVVARGRHATDAHLRLAREVFDAVGRSTVLDEKLMDAVTGLSGSGPAYIYLVIESLAEAGVKVGIPRDVSTLLSAQTVLGAARMVLELGEHPALLKDSVTTPAGCTVDGLLELEEGKLRVTLIKAVVRATERARDLAPERGE